MIWVIAAGAPALRDNRVQRASCGVNSGGLCEAGGFFSGVSHRPIKAVEKLGWLRLVFGRKKRQKIPLAESFTVPKLLELALLR
jgi:hypothetical protein